MIPQINTGTNVDIIKQGSAYIIGATPAGPAFENTLINYLVSQAGYTKFAIIGDNAAYGKGESAYQAAALKANNLEALAVEEHGVDDKDFTGQLTKIMAAQPEVLLLADSEVAGGLVAKQARQLGFEGIIAGGVAMGSAKFLETARDAAEEFSLQPPIPATKPMIKQKLLRPLSRRAGASSPNSTTPTPMISPRCFLSPWKTLNP